MITIKVKGCGCEKSFDEKEYPEYYEWVKKYGTKCCVDLPNGNTIGFGGDLCQLCPWKSKIGTPCICTHNRSTKTAIEIVPSCMKLFD